MMWSLWNPSAALPALFRNQPLPAMARPSRRSSRNQPLPTVTQLFRRQSATVSDSPRTIQVGTNWRKETKIGDDTSEAQYDDNVAGAWGSRRIKVEDDPTQDEQEDDDIPVKAEDDVQEDDDIPVKAQEDSQEDHVQEDIEPSIKTEDDVQDNADSPVKVEDDVKLEEQEEDVDAITPASPPRPHTLPQDNNNNTTTFANLDPNGTLTVTNTNTRIHGVDITDANHMTFTNHPSIPSGLQIRFLKSGSPITDDLMYALPKELYGNLIAQFTGDMTKYLRRWEVRQGAFGTLRAWQQWPSARDNARGDESPHACANCVDLAIMGEVNAQPCTWMLEGGALACQSCADARVFCIVSIGGCPTVLRNPVWRVVGGVDALGVAQEDGGGDDNV